MVKEDHSRKVAAIQMWVMVGSAYEQKGERGISHVIEHMAFKGTVKRGVGQIATELNRSVEKSMRIQAGTKRYSTW